MIRDFDPSIVRYSGKRKIYCRDTGFDCYAGGGFRQNVGMGCVIGKENGMIQHRDERSSGCATVVKNLTNGKACS